MSAPNEGTFTLTPEQEAARREFDPYNAAAIAKYHLPSDWQWFEISSRHEETTGRIEIAGGVPRQGVSNRLRWKDVETLKGSITRADIAHAEAEFERATGYCAKCSGNGYRWAGSAAGQPTRFRSCRDCKGSGLTTPSSQETRKENRE